MTRHECQLCGRLGADLPHAEGAGQFCSRSCEYRFNADARSEEIPAPGDQTCPTCSGWIWAGDPVLELDDRPDVYVHARHRRRQPVEQVDPEPDGQGVAA